MGGKNSFIFHITALLSAIMQTNSSQYCIYIYIVYRRVGRFYTLCIWQFFAVSLAQYGEIPGLGFRSEKSDHERFAL